MGGGDEGAGEQDVLGGVDWTIWVISRCEVGDVAGGSVMDGFVCWASGSQ